MKKGAYGRVYQQIMRNSDLPGGSRLIYAYLSAFAGNSEECYPSVETICKELGMTKTTMYKYMNTLVDYGVVEKKQTYIGNLKSKVIYRITHELMENIRFPKNSETDRSNCSTSEKIGFRNYGNSSQSERNSNNTNNNNIKNKNNKYIVEQNSTAYPFKGIIEYLNNSSGKNYKYSTKATQRHIRARFEEGFTLEDFKMVIDWKVSQWLGDKDMDRYLRPETLFGTKFESYLNESPALPQNLPEETEEPEEHIDLWSEE